MAIDNLLPTSEKGVFYRTEPGRMNGRVKQDRQFVIVYKLSTKKYRGVIGWESEGHSTADALARLREFKRNHKAGSGPVCMADVQTMIDAERTAKEEAEHKAAAALIAADEAERNRPTIAHLWKSYIESNPDMKGIASDLNRFKNYLLPTLGNKTPAEIQPLDIDRLRLGVQKGKIGPAKKSKDKDGKVIETREPKSMQTVKHVLVLLRRIVLFAEKQRLITPCAIDYKIPRVDNQVTEHLTDEEVKRLLVALDEEKDKAAVAVVKLALYSGLRKGEILSLKWRNVDLKRALITLENPKGGKNQILPISAAAVEVLKTVPKVKQEKPKKKKQPVIIEEKEEAKESELVFPGRNGVQRYDLKKPMDRIRKAAGLPEGFRPLHGLRHHFASTLASSGEVDLYTLQKLLTHKDPATTQRYAHLRDDTLRTAADVASNALDRIAKTEEKKSANNGEE